MENSDTQISNNYQQGADCLEIEIIMRYMNDSFYYSLNTKKQEAYLKKYSGDATEIVVPESITYREIAYKVTSLGAFCFYDCSSLTSIKIPASVESLGNCCFSGCSSLTSIKIPISVESLEDCCFSGCSSLTSIKIPISVESLEDCCFSGCSSLESIVVNASNPKYDSREGCNAIIETESNTMITGCKNTRIPMSVTKLGDNCFKGCSSLTSIEIPASVESLGDCCFYDCSSLTSIKIPVSVESLGESCFRDCSSLESIVVGASNPKYDSREGCNAIIETESNTMIAGCKNTRIPMSVTKLGNGCFDGCSSLTSIKIPASVESLGNGCFFGLYLESSKQPKTTKST